MYLQITWDLKIQSLFPQVCPGSWNSAFWTESMLQCQWCWSCHFPKDQDLQLWVWLLRAPSQLKNPVDIIENGYSFFPPQLSTYRTVSLSGSLVGLPGSIYWLLHDKTTSIFFWPRARFLGREKSGSKYEVPDTMQSCISPLNAMVIITRTDSIWTTLLSKHGDKLFFKPFSLTLQILMFFCFCLLTIYFPLNNWLPFNILHI